MPPCLTENEVEKWHSPLSHPAKRADDGYLEKGSRLVVNDEQAHRVNAKIDAPLPPSIASRGVHGGQEESSDIGM